MKMTISFPHFSFILFYLPVSLDSLLITSLLEDAVVPY
jgi:hypothetical protein